jgi:stress-induced morphogen
MAARLYGGGSELTLTIDPAACTPHSYGDSRTSPAAAHQRLSATEMFQETRPMPMDAREIEQLIKSGIPDANVEIRDLAGDGDHYAATVIAESFRGKSRVQQHQLVYQALKGQMGGALHALALQTGIPET